MATADVDAALTGGNYEVLRARLSAAGAELAKRADALNTRRKKVFGATEPQLVATERVRTEHVIGPPLDKMAMRGYIAGKVPNSPANMTQWLQNPQSIDPGNAMPNLGLTPVDARDITAYLFTLK